MSGQEILLTNLPELCRQIGCTLAVAGTVASHEVIIKHIDHYARIPACYSLGTLLGSANHGVGISEPSDCSMQ